MQDPLVFLLTLFLCVSVLTYLTTAAGLRGYQQVRARFADPARPDLGLAHYLLTDPRAGRQLSLLGLALGLLGGFAANLTLPLVVATGAGTAALAAGLHRLARRRRAARLDEQFLQALGLLTSALRAGRSLPQAFESALPFLQAPMSAEFLVITRQLKLGIPLHESLAAFAGRLPSEDAKQAVRTMIFAATSGADLALVLSEIGDIIRARRSLDRKIDTLTANGRAQGLILGLLPLGFLLAMAISSPNHVQTLFHTPAGNAALLVIGVLQALAFYFVRRITRIDV